MTPILEKAKPDVQNDWVLEDCLTVLAKVRITLLITVSMI